MAMEQTWNLIGVTPPPPPLLLHNVICLLRSFPRLGDGQGAGREFYTLLFSMCVFLGTGP
jgi:hypothetical protein